MELDRQFRHRSRQTQGAGDFMQLESVLLEGGRLDEAELRRLPEASLSASPLLMQELGRICYRKGELHEAKRRLEDAVKGFAALAFPSELRFAICSLVHVLLRLGETSAAETLLVFILQEYERMPGNEREGELPHALAAGSHLIDSLNRTKRWYMEAIDLYEQRQRTKDAAFVMAELMQRCGESVTPDEWGALAWRLRRWTAVSGEHRDCADLILSLRDAQQQQWERFSLRLEHLIRSARNEKKEDYLLSIHIQLLHSRVMAELRSDAAASSLDGLVELRHTYAADLVLQHDVLLALGAGFRSLGRVEEAELALAEAGYVGRYLKLPGYIDSDPPASNRASAPQSAPFESPPLSSSMDRTASEWRVRFFGGLTFENGVDVIRQIRWKRKKALELFIFLLCQPKYMCPKDQLTDLLELGDNPDKANKTLYVMIHQLKQTLSEQLSISNGVYTREGLVMLRDDAFEYVDIEKYQALVRVADQLWSRNRELSCELYEEAYVMYDDLLPEFPYFTWLDNIREYLLDKQTAVIRKLCQIAEEQQDFQLEETYCQEWIRLRPYQEEAYQRLLHLLIRSKRLSEVSFVYERFAVRCRDELGIEPSEELRSLLRRSGFESFS